MFPWFRVRQVRGVGFRVEGLGFKEFRVSVFGFWVRS